jgi:Holliday junction resolvase RusA-like endonuclease
MTATITIPGSVRSKKNSKRIFARGPFKKVLPSKAYEAWEKQARQSLWGKAIVPPISSPCSVKAVFFYKGPKPDLTAGMEAIADCLQGIIWADDGFIESWDGSRMVHDLENPRTEVEVKW